MGQILRISGANAMALHGMAVLARNPSRSLSAKKISELLKVSRHHLVKVLERLEKQGLVKSVRGPGGGYILAKDSRKIRLLDIYEAMEGRFKPEGCLFEKKICNGKGCVLGGFLKVVNNEFRDYLAGTRLSDVNGFFN